MLLTNLKVKHNPRKKWFKKHVKKIYIISCNKQVDYSIKKREKEINVIFWSQICIQLAIFELIGIASWSSSICLRNYPEVVWVFGYLKFFSV